MGKIIDFKAKKEEKIPKGQYCDGCPYYEYMGKDYLLRDLRLKGRVNKDFVIEKEDRWIECESAGNCTAECVQNGKPTCFNQRVRCNYMNMQDDSEETLLWDKVKECGINDD